MKLSERITDIVEKWKKSSNVINILSIIGMGAILSFLLELQDEWTDAASGLLILASFVLVTALLILEWKKRSRRYRAALIVCDLVLAFSILILSTKTEVRNIIECLAGIMLIIAAIYLSWVRLSGLKRLSLLFLEIVAFLILIFGIFVNARVLPTKWKVQRDTWISLKPDKLLAISAYHFYDDGTAGRGHHCFISRAGSWSCENNNCKYEWHVVDPGIIEVTCWCPSSISSNFTVDSINRYRIVDDRYLKPIYSDDEIINIKSELPEYHNMEPGSIREALESLNTFEIVSIKLSKVSNSNVIQPQKVDNIPPKLSILLKKSGYEAPDVLKTDLNDDGKDDFIATYPRNCGSGGCNYEIFIYDRDGYKQIDAPDLFGGEPTVSKEEHDGMHSIAQITGGDHFCGPDSKNILTTFEYQAGKYISKRNEEKPYPCK